MSYLNGNNVLFGANAVQIEVDDELSTTSEYPVQNKVITAALNKKMERVELTYVGTGTKAIKLGNDVLTFTEIKALCESADKFVYLVYENKLFIPSFIGLDVIYFDNTYFSATDLVMNKIFINSSNVVNFTTANIIDEVDDELSTSSENPVQNKVVTTSINNLANGIISTLTGARINLWTLEAGVYKVANGSVYYDETHSKNFTNRILIVDKFDAFGENNFNYTGIYFESGVVKQFLTNVNSGVITGMETQSEFVLEKVTSISGSSTDDEYPSAKAVYDAIQAACVVDSEGTV